MEVRIFIVFALVLAFGCEEHSEESLCREFAELNDGLKFTNLYDVSIGSGRVQSLFNQDENKYYLKFNSIGMFDSTERAFQLVPVFRRNASDKEIDSIYINIDESKKVYLRDKFNTSLKSETVSRYSRYVQAIYADYDSIATPSWFSYNNVATEGRPDLGRFIEFKLKEGVILYYVENERDLSAYWYNKFRALKKVRSRWYCEITHR